MPKINSQLYLLLNSWPFKKNSTHTYRTLWWMPTNGLLHNYISVSPREKEDRKNSGFAKFQPVKTAWRNVWCFHFECIDNRCPDNLISRGMFKSISIFKIVQRNEVIWVKVNLIEYGKKCGRLWIFRQFK